jgi:hypothetical protein
MEMAVRSMETAETAMETDGDGSGGTSLSRKGAGIETSVPQNSSTAAAELRNCSRNFTDSSRVFRLEASYRRRGIVRGQPGSYQGGAARAWAAPPMCEGGLWPPSSSLLVFGKLLGKIRLLELVLSNSENISYVAFLKYKNSRKQGTGTVASCQ